MSDVAKFILFLLLLIAASTGFSNALAIASMRDKCINFNTTH